MKLDIYKNIRPLMESKGVVVTPSEFHRAVNLAFHDAESRHYDTLHRKMWESLPGQFSLLSGDLLGSGPMPASLEVLDIGCGTGLSSELMLRTGLGERIAKITLLDTSSGMLAECARRASAWGVAHELIEGTVDQLVGIKYDLVIICSVLHHIVDLPEFLARVASLQSSGGAVIHLHDPNGDYLQHPNLLRRTAELKSTISGQVPPPARRRPLLGLLRRLVGGRPRDYIDVVNQTLLEQGIIKNTLSDEEIWSVTDIHDVGLPHSIGDGISLEGLSGMLVHHKLVSARSYGFFGGFPSELPDPFREREKRLTDEGCMEGSFLGASWRFKD
jgi:2-polyprenyl-3-methyl-5-hydroxy-6-metoxy-1,4-benzoquinol methylase